MTAIPLGGSCSLGKRLNLASDSSNSLTCWRFSCLRCRFPQGGSCSLGERLNLDSDFSNSSDLLEIFYIFAVDSPNAEAAVWGKGSILLLIPPTDLICWRFSCLRCRFPQGETRPLGERLYLDSDSSNSLTCWRFFISSLSIPPRRKLQSGEKL